jgi:phosphate acetyltransferase
MSFFYDAERIVRRYQHKIVLPEGNDIRVIGAAARLKNNSIMEPILLGKRDKILQIAKENGIDMERVQIIDPDTYEEREELIPALVERRKGKLTEEEARELIKDENYFGTMLVYTQRADGLVSGAIHTTGETVKPALQIIKVKPEYSKVSGGFLLIRDKELYVFGDCAINIDPTAEDLAEIAKQTAETAKNYGITPRVAMLSFSTKGSGKGPMVDKVRRGYEIAKEKYPELVIDGELQFDAAFVPEVAAKKLKTSPVAGKANVFIFPDIQAGNIGYKIAQRLGKFEAIGPILQGLNSPVNDLSRGCNEEDVYKLCIISSMEAIKITEERQRKNNA